MKIAIVTGTRAEYGLLYWVIKKIHESQNHELQLIVTGMHLSPEFGFTVTEIEKDGFPISKRVEILLSSDSSIGTGKSVGLGVISFSECFGELEPDLCLLLGDRFEILAAATAAMLARIPIAHCHGGEATEGLIDESIRHSITKMSHLHFTSTEAYRKRVVQLGENPNYVFNVGALGLENINKLELLTMSEVENSLGIKLNQKTFLITYHPVTLDNKSSKRMIGELIQALNRFDNVQYIFTLPNADNNGRVIIEKIKEYERKNSGNVKVFTSLGQLRYLSLLQYCSIVVGNSSSGLIEVPSFKIPTVNIGDRQRGRIAGPTVINCGVTTDEIFNAVNSAMSKSDEFELMDNPNPYDGGNSSDEILDKLDSIDLSGIIKKSFYNIDFSL